MPAALCLIACAMVYEGKYDWDEGWRVGQVVKIGTGIALRSISPGDCRKGATPVEVARTRYADVRYQSEGRWSRHRIVPLAEDQVLDEGQIVYFNASDCRKGLVRASPDS